MSIFPSLEFILQYCRNRVSYKVHTPVIYLTYIIRLLLVYV